MKKEKISKPAHTKVFEYRYNFLKSLSEEPSLVFSALEINENILYTLSLNGIKELNTTEARNIIGFEGSIIELNGLVAISVEVAKILVQFKGALSLGIEILEPEIAAILQKHSGALTLTKLNYLKDESIDLITQYQGNVLEFSSLMSLSPYQAILLANFKGEYLTLGLTWVSIPVAQALAAYPGFLFLDALTEISADVANALSKHKGSILLDGLSFLSDDAAFALARKSGRWMELNGLSSLSDNAIIALSRRKGNVSLAQMKQISSTGVKIISESTNIEVRSPIN